MVGAPVDTSMILDRGYSAVPPPIELGTFEPEVNEPPSRSIFTRQLFRMCTTEDPRIISFTADGLALHIKDTYRLETEILPKYFRHSRFQSFMRQINFYNFKRKSNDREVYVYQHDCFQLHRPELLTQLKRRSVTTTARKRRTAEEMQAVGQKSTAGRRRSRGGRFRATVNNPYLPLFSSGSEVSMSSDTSQPPSPLLPSNSETASISPLSESPRSYFEHMSGSADGAGDAKRRRLRGIESQFVMTETPEDEEESLRKSALKPEVVGKALLMMRQASMDDETSVEDPMDEIEEEEGEDRFGRRVSGQDPATTLGRIKSADLGSHTAATTSPRREGLEGTKREVHMLRSGVARTNSVISGEENEEASTTSASTSSPARPFANSKLHKAATLSLDRTTTSVPSVQQQALPQAPVITRTSSMPSCTSPRPTIPSSTYNPTASDLADWRQVCESWAAISSPQQCDFLETLPANEHRAFSHFFLCTAPYLSQDHLYDACHFLLCTYPYLANAVRAHCAALDPLGPCFGGLDARGSDRAFKEMLSYGMNVLTEAVRLTEGTGKGGDALKLCMLIWRKHAGRVLL